MIISTIGNKKATAPIALWLALLPEPYNHQALENALEDILLFEVNSFSLALSVSFIWDYSPEGRYYWEKLSLKLKNNNL